MMDLGRERQGTKGGYKMELHTEIKKWRTKLNLSQEALAEKIYVTRQTISNWENNKSYPDINSLLLLSSTFNISLDQLILGDVKIMREEINKEEQKKFHRDGTVFTILLLFTIISSVPLIVFINKTGWIICAILFMITMYFGHQVDKAKKNNDMHTYKEIIAFTEGKTLDEIKKAQEIAVRPYQKIVVPIAFGLASFVVCGIIGAVCIMVKILYK
jgi:transcriptional regulator with XRE-family HTH domain